MSENKQDYTIREAAHYLKVSEPTIYRWMKDGDLSFYKVGRGTRFTQEQLDQVKITHTSRPEAKERKGRCVCCGHSELVKGFIQNTDLVYFKPDKTSVLTLDTSTIKTEAWACTSCGYVQMHADPEKLQRLTKHHD